MRRMNLPQSDVTQQDGYLEELDIIQSSLSRALQDVRGISTGLRLPELESLTLAETIGRVVRSHERRTSSKVTVNLECLPEQVDLPVKITVYRLIQEALSNAFRHGSGVDQRVRVECDGLGLNVEVSDSGPGFEWKGIPSGGQHLGLTSMRERAESLGGALAIETGLGRGTRVIASLPARAAVDPAMTAPEEDVHER